MEDYDLAKYIYWQYTIAVMAVTEVIKFFLKKINVKFIQYLAVKEPKWITLVVATALALFDFIVISGGDKLNIYQLLISFSLAILGYDYLYNPIKNQIRKGINETPATPPN